VYGYYYQTISNWHSGQCVTASRDRGRPPIQQSTCVASSWQQWMRVNTDNGWFELVVAATGDCMEVPGSSQSDNYVVVRAPCDGDYNQQWLMVTAPIGGGYVFLVARHSGKCLAILSESLQVGAKLVQYACTPYSPVIDPIGGSYWHFD